MGTWQYPLAPFSLSLIFLFPFGSSFWNGGGDSFSFATRELGPLTIANHRASTRLRQRTCPDPPGIVSLANVAAVLDDGMKKVAYHRDRLGFRHRTEGQRITQRVSELSWSRSRPFHTFQMMVFSPRWRVSRAQKQNPDAGIKKKGRNFSNPRIARSE